jgi:hypothetical protein
VLKEAKDYEKKAAQAQQKLDDLAVTRPQAIAAAHQRVNEIRQSFLEISSRMDVARLALDRDRRVELSAGAERNGVTCVAVHRDSLVETLCELIWRNELGQEVQSRLQERAALQSVTPVMAQATVRLPHTASAGSADLFNMVDLKTEVEATAVPKQ